MKRLLTSMLIVMIILSCAFPLSVSAEDSFDLSAEDLSLIEEQFGNADSVMKIYRGALTYEFASGKSISDVIEQRERIFDRYMVRFVEEDWICTNIYEIQNGALSFISGADGKYVFFLNAVSTEALLGDVTVKHMFCLDGLSDGVYIYYQTDGEDYVLYKSYLESKKAYLLPLDVFVSFAKEAQNERERNKGKVGAWTLESVVGERLVPYDVSDLVIPKEDPPIETETPATETREPDVETPIVTYTPPEETVTPPDETVPQPYETVTPEGETAAPSGTPGNAIETPASTETPAPNVPESKDTPKGGKTVPIVCASAAVLIAAGAVFCVLRAKKKKGQ